MKEYGLLFSDGHNLKMMNFNEKRIVCLENVEGWTYDAEVHNGDVYYVCNLLWGRYEIRRLMERGKKYIRSQYISEVLSLEDRIVDVGLYGICDTESGEMIIPMEEMKREGIYFINTIFRYRKEIAVGVTYISHRRYKDHSCGIVLVDLEKGKIGEEIIHYDTNLYSLKNEQRWQARMLNEKEIVSCVYRKHLDIGGKKIEGTEVEKNGMIWRITPTRDVVWYSGYGLGGIKWFNLTANSGGSIMDNSIHQSSIFPDWIPALKSISKEVWDKLVPKAVEYALCN